MLFTVSVFYPQIRTFDLSVSFSYNKGEIKNRRSKDYENKAEYFYLDDFEHRLLVGCLMTARNEYIHEGKTTEDVNELILKIIDAPTKKLRVIVKEEA